MAECTAIAMRGAHRLCCGPCMESLCITECQTTQPLACGCCVATQSQLVVSATQMSHMPARYHRSDHDSRP